MRKVKFVHVECFFIFFKNHFLLKNKCSLISVHWACFDELPQLLQMDNN